jgi:uncharacterized protein YqeY
MLKDKFQEELKEAMLSKDTLKTSVIRMLLSAVNYYEIQKGVDYKATDDDVLIIIQKEVKKHQESIDQFKNAKREDLVEKEEKEQEILKAYLPLQMEDSELKKIVEEALSQTSASSLKDLGKVMAIVMPKVKGKADGGRVSSLIKEFLSKT